MLYRARPRQTHMSQQRARGQLFQQLPRRLEIAAPNVLAWIGTHHPAMMGPWHASMSSSQRLRFEHLTATTASGQQGADDTTKKPAARLPIAPNR